MSSQNRYDGFDRYAIAIIRRKARQLGRQLQCDPLDIEQELAIDLHLRLRQYDPAQLPEHVFISQIIDHKVASIIKHEHAQMRDGRREERSLNDAPPDQADNQETAFGDTIDSEIGRASLSPEELRQLKHDLTVIAEELPEQQRRLVEQLLDDPNFRKASHNLNVHRSTAYEYRDKLQERFENAGLREYLKKRPTHRGRKAY